MILTRDLSVYSAAIENGDFEFSSLLAESGLLCPACGSADCGKYHGRWCRKRVRDLSSGRLFEDLPLLRARFCDKSTKTIYPAELWRGHSTVTSVLESVIYGLRCGLEAALQRIMDAGDGDESVGERSLRRWLKRVESRLPVAVHGLGLDSGRVFSGVAEKLEHVLNHLYPRHLLELRHQWGFSLLDVPAVGAPEVTCTASYPRPVSQKSLPPQDPPAHYLPRGRRSWLIRRE